MNTSEDPIFAGLDIGTTAARCIVGTVGTSADGEESISVLGVGVAAQKGIRRGMVVNTEDAAHALQEAVEAAERQSGLSIQSVFININGQHIESRDSKGVIAVGGSDREITEDDVLRVEEAATVVQLANNVEIVEVFPREFHLDGQGGIKDPVGMTGVRLEIDACLVTGSTPVIKNIQKVLDLLDIGISGKSVGAISAGEVVLSEAQRENGAAVVDIGASTTGIAVFEDGELLHTAVLPIGSNHITNDLAIGIRTDLPTAQKIKHSLVDLSTTGKKKLSIKNSQNEIIAFENKDIVSIVEARLEELGELIADELHSIKRFGQLPGGLVLIGGGANLQGIEIILREFLKLPVSLARKPHVNGLKDAINNPALITGFGLLVEDINNGSMQPVRRKNANLQKKMSGMTKSFTQLIQKLKP